MSDVEEEDITEVTNGETEKFLGSHATVSDFTKECLGKVALANRLCNALPTEGEEYDLCTSYPGFHRVMTAQTERLMNLMTRLLRYQNVKARLEGSSLEESCDYLVDVNDVLLEKVGSELDEAAGIKKVADPVLVSATAPLTQPNTSWNRRIHDKGKDQLARGKKPYRLISARNIPRPQLQFKQKIVNDNEPFVPKIKEKPNAIRPLVNLAHIADDDGTEFFPHPYEWELEKFKPPPHFLEMKEPQPAKPLEDTSLTYVDSVEDLQQVFRDLSQAKEIAVDLEHHAYRTYLGLTCLMQISTREKDYIIDTLSLRDDLQPLNETFTNPNILKIFHGATLDVQWLQRDLGVYVVGMFDTFEAAKLLQYPHLSLAYLAKILIGRTLDKQYQLADWRIRPLPEELLKYAREDTHHLLHIYDLLKKELLDKGNEQKNLLHQTYNQSRLVCATRYETPICDESTMLTFYRKSRKAFNTRQMFAFKALYEWRDTVARNEDESHAYVMPNHMMLAVAEVLPREMQGILALGNPTPPLIKQQLLTLHHIMLEARDQPLQQAVSSSEAAIPTAWKAFEKDWDSPLYCPHDLGDRENKPGLPTLMDKNLSFTLSSLPPTKPYVTVYTQDGAINKKAQETAKRIAGLLYWLNPYERYRLVQPLDKPEITTDDPKRDRVSELRQHVMSLVGEQTENAENPPQSTEQTNTQQQQQELTDVEKLTAPLRTMLPYKTSKKKKRPEPFYYTAPDPAEKRKWEPPELRPVPESEYQMPQEESNAPNNKSQKKMKTQGKVGQKKEAGPNPNTKPKQQQQEKRKRANEEDSKSSEEPPTKSPKVQSTAKSPRITKKKPEKQKEHVVLTGYKKKGEEKNEEEDKASVVPYDYSKEDTSKFKGGAQQAAHKLNQYANKFFKGKPKAKARRSGGKMTTFKVKDKK